MPSWLVNATFATSINKRLCHDTATESTIQWTRAGLGRHHVAFAVANSLLNLRFATATVGSYSVCWKPRRLLEAATGCRQGPQYDGKCSFYFNYFFCTTPINWNLRQKAIYFPAQANVILFIKQYFQIKITICNVFSITPEAWKMHTVLFIKWYLID